MSAPSQYCIYLRKSRADLEAEAHGEGETLARHERMLLELSKRQNLNITQIYREIVSGETIAARPIMQKLLSEVGAGMWSGVLVVEVERLARGDTMDQGLMAQTFKYSGTKIITPMRTYDPENEFDEEYFEFGLFMSRREYKTINRRLLRGRLASAKEGKFVSGYAPYGYERVRVPHDKGWTLRPSALADNVRLIFRYYTEGEKLDDGSVRRFTLSELAARLDELGIPTPGSSETWQKQGVIRLLSNPVYAGKIRWNYKSGKKQIVDGSVRIKHQKSAPEDVILVDGLHPALVTDEAFCKAQKLISTARAPAVTTEHGLKNPLAGLLFCGKCGKAIIRNHVCKEGAVLGCINRSCDNIGSYVHLVEERLLRSLGEWLEDDSLLAAGSMDAIALTEKQDAVQAVAKELAILRGQLSSAHDLLEQRVYDVETFLNRSRVLTDRIADAENRLGLLSGELAEDEQRAASRRLFLPMVDCLLKEYDGLSVREKNIRLKSVLEKVVYTKSVRSHHSAASADDFELVLYPRITGK